MRILFDIIHPSDVNFFKNTINILLKRNMDVEVIFRHRGKTADILRRELSDIQVTAIGRHHKSSLIKIFSLIGRVLYLSMFLHGKNYDAAASFGSFHLSAACRVNRIPSVLFGDDYEYLGKFGRSLLRLSGADYRVIPACIPMTGDNVLKFNGFKELAYLHPNYFKPDKRILNQYELTPHDYVFIREVDRRSLNYRNLQQMDLPEIIQDVNKLGLDVVLSLEDKTRADSFKDKCIVLEEPVDDIFSLLSFALFTISSGDSMARESCLVGTPTLYTGGRGMFVNREFIERSCMFKVDDEQQLNVAMTNIIENNIKEETIHTIERAIRHEWMDTTEVILDVLEAVTNKDESVIEKYKLN